MKVKTPHSNNHRVTPYGNQPSREEQRPLRGRMGRRDISVSIDQYDAISSGERYRLRDVTGGFCAAIGRRPGTDGLVGCATCCHEDGLDGTVSQKEGTDFHYLTGGIQSTLYTKDQDNPSGYRVRDTRGDTDWCSEDAYPGLGLHEMSRSEFSLLCEQYAHRHQTAMPLPFSRTSSMDATSSDHATDGSLSRQPSYSLETTIDSLMVSSRFHDYSQPFSRQMSTAGTGSSDSGDDLSTVLEHTHISTSSDSPDAYPSSPVMPVSPTSSITSCESSEEVDLVALTAYSRGETSIAPSTTPYQVPPSSPVQDLPRTSGDGQESQITYGMTLSSIPEPIHSVVSRVLDEDDSDDYGSGGSGSGSSSFRPPAVGSSSSATYGQLSVMPVIPSVIEPLTLGPIMPRETINGWVVALGALAGLSMVGFTAGGLVLYGLYRCYKSYHQAPPAPVQTVNLEAWAPN